MRTALYIRVSTREQLDGFSISAQKRQLTAYCESQGWEIMGYYVEEGASAKNTNRPELKRMITHIENDLIDCVLVYKLDRLTRSVLDLYNLLQKFEENNCKFKSATEVYDTTSAIGRMFITLVASFAQFERERLGERVSMGMEQMTREGKWKGGTVGYGHNKIDGNFVIVEHEASILKDMYEWYLSGLSDRSIAIKLNEMGLETRTGAEWDERKVKYVLTNKKNVGTLQYGVRVNQDKSFEVDDIYPPIIDKKTFDRALATRDARRKFHGKQATSSYYFSGILRCSRCGAKMKGIKARQYKRYRCTNNLYHKCDMPSFSELFIEQKFIDYLKNIAFNENEVEINPLDNKENKQKIRRLEKEIDKIKQRQKKWQYAWANEMLTDEEFQDRMKEEHEKHAEYEKKIAKFNMNKPNQINSEIIEMMKSTANNWEALEQNEKKQLMQIVIDKIIVDIDEDKKGIDKVDIKEITFN
ncbi:recombinase family protein [Virgibacillus sp. AGTR]|uniref:recombinase family protein n=1 Tax=Virgibacillus sp. AGTR TaxID=2812055 RepID=UPI0019624B75|nr:recombinase family protein [Virgibacillus sp. AGTR]MCC2250022.1 recombinase family protein [Virgibacillus sp. AGTR]QRZ17797.1 recombinase family protein [Virgibacillus sp. AGTR]